MTRVSSALTALAVSTVALVGAAGTAGPAVAATPGSVTAECSAQGYGVQLSAAFTPIGCDYGNFIGDSPRGATLGCVIGVTGFIAGALFFPAATGARVAYTVAGGSSAYGVVTTC